jgi:hypothetical protein
MRRIPHSSKSGEEFVDETDPIASLRVEVSEFEHGTKGCHDHAG